MRDFCVLSSLIKSSVVMDNGRLRSFVTDDLFVNKVHAIVSAILGKYLENSCIDSGSIVLTVKRNIPDYILLKLLRSLKVSINSRGKFIILNTD